MLAIVRSESTSSSAWQSANWELLPSNLPGLVSLGEPPAPQLAVDARSAEQFEAEIVDLQDALETEVRYREKGGEGLLRYSDYRARRTE